MRFVGRLGRIIAYIQLIPSRRLYSFVALLLILSILGLLLTPSSLSSDAEHHRPISFELPSSIADLRQHVPSIYVPDFSLNPFRTSLTHHSPPPPSDSGNSTANTKGWFSDWKWLNPFSSNIAKDEERVVLPPLEKRCPVYTFYDPEEAGNKNKDVEDKVLLAWRRAWWAHGFKPIVLGMGEARENGLYRSVLGEGLSKELEKEVMRWLAWSQMGTGVLMDYHIFPMHDRHDILFSSLRRCDFEYATRFENFGNLLYAADKKSIDAVLKHITTSVDNSTKTIEAATINTQLFHIDPFPVSLGDYTPASVQNRYPTLKTADLPVLINSHLHQSFLASYPAGIALLTPFSTALTPVHMDAYVLATKIAFCPDPRNPFPDSCPPNNIQCVPCKKPVSVSQTANYSNLTTPASFTIATVPHPYTLASLLEPGSHFSSVSVEKVTRYLRRKTKRDAWLKEVTKSLLKSGYSASPRVVSIKAAVAAERSQPFLSLWATSDMGFNDLPWVLGFTLPTVTELGIQVPAPEEVARSVMVKANKEINADGRGGTEKGLERVRKVVEAWNLGDTEVWKFTGAWGRRAVMERREWSTQEGGFGFGVSEEEKNGL
ncbi:hypothetical protein RUND412_008389 [Rhizina undulata]